jgi:hypothetical protein
VNETNLQIVRLVISIVKELAKLVITVLGFYVVISTGPDRFYHRTRVLRSYIHRP